MYETDGVRGFDYGRNRRVKTLLNVAQIEILQGVLQRPVGRQAVTGIILYLTLKAPLAGTSRHSIQLF